MFLPHTRQLIANALISSTVVLRASAHTQLVQKSCMQVYTVGAGASLNPVPKWLLFLSSCWGWFLQHRICMQVRAVGGEASQNPDPKWLFFLSSC